MGTVVLIVGMLASPVSADGELDLASLLPDIKKIYEKALTSPFQEAEKEIYDVKIRDFYHNLVDECGLDEPVED